MFGGLCSFTSPVGLGLHLLAWTVLRLGLVFNLTNYSSGKLLVEVDDPSSQNEADHTESMSLKIKIFKVSCPCPFPRKTIKEAAMSSRA